MLGTKPKIAVLLATFNGEVWLQEQLESIQNQSNVDVSIVVSDDCSFDNTLQGLKTEMNAIGKRLILLPTQKLGSAAANFFRLLRDVDLSDVDYVALSDQDDIWLPNKLSHALEVTHVNQADAYSSNVIAFWPNGKKKIINKAQIQQDWDYMLESAGPGCTFVITKKLALALQDFLVKNKKACQSVDLHDWFIYAFARSKGYKWIIDDGSYMLYRQHADNVVGANVGLKAKLVRWRKLREGWLVQQALLIADILNYGNYLPMRQLRSPHVSDRLSLIINVKKLRRRWRDRMALILFLLLPLNK